ncbi:MULTISPECIES: hypothetical protein [Pseudomonas]|jgi:hypothetical protein|uniref:Uncharacterized protein n=1 Tax=Pseudomonas quebecensis TaxID=2995174 RepID=A0ABY6QAZ5_9PSED|nr:MULTISPECIES: hypothetical protein [Pseudomonas]MCP1510748.1 hypothetical protein [Pseudomonas rhodesiae]MCX4067049.1 hypothetical protein [Pseudomonas quebecensis]MDF9769562.1 hypothetical protein [Pseudomonas rhodesiae]UZW16470.1 hypothetical protein OSC50_13770 [Pseudomonas quebecensis]UZW26117.1 hypothetical protein OSC48_11710 [Pseudomonas quebecensis]
MQQPHHPSSNSLRYLIAAVVGIALMLGAYFMHINAQADRERAMAAERLALCQQVARVASVTANGSLDVRDTCEQLSEQSQKSTPQL